MHNYNYRPAANIDNVQYRMNCMKTFAPFTHEFEIIGFQLNFAALRSIERWKSASCSRKSLCREQRHSSNNCAEHEVANLLPQLLWLPPTDVHPVEPIINWRASFPIDRITNGTATTTTTSEMLVVVALNKWIAAFVFEQTKHMNTFVCMLFSCMLFFHI